jgi:putative ABC transport system permease protein
VAAANLIAWPVGYYFMSDWLTEFAYRTDLGVDVFLFAGLITMGIAMLTIGWQAFRAARANPVKALRYE